MQFLELELLESAKETDNKLRWDANVSGVKFEMYIPKWRVPTPWPRRILVRVDPRRFASHDAPNLSKRDVEKEPTLASEPIVAIVRKHSRKTQTVRYDPTTDANSAEIGSPYIPFSLCPDEPERLRVMVLWDATVGSRFE